MRLIDTTPFDIKLMDIPDGSEDYKQGYIDGARHVLEEMDEAQTVDAVPLEPLCRYLEVYARTPIYNMRHTAEWWKEELEKEKWEKWTVEQNA